MKSEGLPIHDYMRSSQKFVDGRLAEWCCEQEIQPVNLPLAKNWLKPIHYDESILNDFLLTDPRHVSKGMRTFAFKASGSNKPPKLKSYTRPSSPIC